MRSELSIDPRVAQEFRFPDGQTRFVRAWNPRTESGNTLVIMHGLGDHSGRYEYLAKYFNSQGWNCLAADQFGHGKSPGRRGCVSSFDSMLDEVERTIRLAQSLWPANRVAVLGQSMGGNIILNYAIHRSHLPYAFVATAPMIEAVHPPPPLMMSILRMIRPLVPNIRIKAQVRPEWLSRDTNEQKLFTDDSLMHCSISLQLGEILVDGGQAIIRDAKRIQVPTLIMHGSDDQMTSPDASRRVVENSSHCTFKLWPEMKHDMHRDIGHQDVFSHALNWLNSL